jgi:hypothetical protein
MRIDSTVREATYPRATLSLTRFTWGNDHGGGYAGDRQQDFKQCPNGYADVAAADNVVEVVQDRVVEKKAGIAMNVPRNQAPMIRAVRCSAWVGTYKT